MPGFIGLECPTEAGTEQPENFGGRPGGSREGVLRGPEPLRGSGASARGFDVAIARPRTGDERVEEITSHRCHLLDSAIERHLVHPRGFVKARELPYELERGSADLLVGRGRGEVEERLAV